MKDRLLAYYEKNETRLELAFFLGGFVFDLLTLSEIDDSFAILQQFIYLTLIGVIVYFNFLAADRPANAPFQPVRWLKWPWDYRDLALHFLLGSLLSIYSLFFFKSASFFSSIVFVLFLAAVMVANELKSVKGGGMPIKLALFMLCLFCFFSILVPILLGFIGWLPFLLAFALTSFFLYIFYRGLRGRISAHALKKQLLWPGAGVLGTFFLLYLLAWIPPVPLSAKKMGIYHKIERVSEGYVLYHENPWWKFWNSGDQNFVAAPGDKIHFLAGVFSPASFADAVIVHWAYRDPRQGWISADRIPMKVAGGRQGGYRGVTTKQNITEGEWRVGVETTDGREIGRLYFSVVKVPEVPSDRVFRSEIY